MVGLEFLLELPQATVDTIGVIDTPADVVRLFEGKLLAVCHGMTWRDSIGIHSCHVHIPRRCRVCGASTPPLEYSLSMR